MHLENWLSKFLATQHFTKTKTIDGIKNKSYEQIFFGKIPWLLHQENSTIQEVKECLVEQLQQWKAQNDLRTQYGVKTMQKLDNRILKTSTKSS